MHVLAHIIVNQSKKKKKQLIKIVFNQVGVVTALDLVDMFTTYNPGMDNRNT